MEKKYLVKWFSNGWHNGTWYGKNMYDVIMQLKDACIVPKEIVLLRN